MCLATCKNEFRIHFLYLYVLDYAKQGVSQTEKMLLYVIMIFFLWPCLVGSEIETVNKPPKASIQ